MRRALIFGGHGLLAAELGPALERAGFEVRRLRRDEADVRLPDALARTLEGAAATLAVNCAAYTAVDRAEEDADACFEVNATGAGNVARACACTGVPLLHLSTDYVFDGRKGAPHLETDAPSPLGVYARSKLEGERAVEAAHASAWIVRTGELYGDGGRNFFDAVLAHAQSGQPVRVVDDQIVSPTWTRELAEQLAEVVQHAPFGLYHATSDGETSWYGAARAAWDELGLTAPLVPVSTAAFASPTPRPAYSVLSHARLASLGLYRMLPWRAALASWLAERARRG